MEPSTGKDDKRGRECFDQGRAADAVGSGAVQEGNSLMLEGRVA